MYYKITCEHFGCLICFRYFPREALKFNHLFPHQFGLFSTRIKKKKILAIKQSKQLTVNLHHMWMSAFISKVNAMLLERF